MDFGDVILYTLFPSFMTIQACSQCIFEGNRGNVPSVLVRCSPMPDDATVRQNFMGHVFSFSSFPQHEFQAETHVGDKPPPTMEVLSAAVPEIYTIIQSSYPWTVIKKQSSLHFLITFFVVLKVWR